MSNADATDRFPGGWAQVFSEFSDEVAEVLDEGSMDETSRADLASLYRRLSRAAAIWTDQREVNPTPADEEENWYRTWADHVGAWHVAFGLGSSLGHALYDARMVWLDELDAMSDAELLSVRGVGRTRLRQIRDALNLYYWRTDHDMSRALWDEIAGRLRRALEYPYLRDGRRERASAGLVLVEQVLARSGRPLIEDPATPRMIG